MPNAPTDDTFESVRVAYGVYARYTEGIEQEAQEILGYLGRDFLTPEKARAPSFPLPPLSESDGEDSGENQSPVELSPCEA